MAEASDPHQSPLLNGCLTPGDVSVQAPSNRAVRTRMLRGVAGGRSDPPAYPIRPAWMTRLAGLASLRRDQPRPDPFRQLHSIDFPIHQLHDHRVLLVLQCIQVMTVENEKCSADDERCPLIAIDKYLIASDGKRVLRRHSCNVWRWVPVLEQVSWTSNPRLESTPIAQPFKSTMLGKLFSVDRQNDIPP